jgi:menaquinone-dependent protoporphyrinogen oxidase
MAGKVLVAYGSWCGSTSEVAAEIAAVLREAGLEVELRRARDVRDVSLYAGAVIGTAIRAGHCTKEVLGLVRKHGKQLRQMPVAIFSVGLQVKERTAQNEAKALQFLEPLRQELQPRAIGLFAGALDARKVGFPLSLIVRALPQGDFRDWAAIRSWGRDVARLMLAET